MPGVNRLRAGVGLKSVDFGIESLKFTGNIPATCGQCNLPFQKTLAKPEPSVLNHAGLTGIRDTIQTSGNSISFHAKELRLKFITITTTWNQLSTVPVYYPQDCDGLAVMR